MSLFEGSFLGDKEKISPATVMECGVCWWVYDPAVGDDVWQIAAGTPFTQLPSHWRCPNCDAAPHQFMVLEQSVAHEHPERASGLRQITESSAALQSAYERAREIMSPLPVYNAKLDVNIVGMRRCAHGLIAVAATPWSMNLLLLPNNGAAGREGTSRELAFPSGSYSFITGHLEGVGVIETCSLFSPMNEFDDPGVVEAVARHAIEALFVPEANSAQPRPMSRREFLRPRGAPQAGRGA